MREILFRGKSVYNGEWYEGSLRIVTYQPADDAPFQQYEIEETTCGVFPNEFMSGYCETVDPATVGQYTGLTDKNGKKIFEGDIVRHFNDCPSSEIEEKGAVFYDEEYCGWRRTSNGAFHHGIADTYRLSPTCCYEVIGNIHGDLELLEG